MSVRRRSAGVRPWALSLLAVGLAATVMVACGDDDNDAGSGGTGTQTTAPSSSPTSPKFDPNATIRYGMDFEGGVGPTLDPAKYNSNPTLTISNLVYGTMFRRTPDG